MGGGGEDVVVFFVFTSVYLLFQFFVVSFPFFSFIRLSMTSSHFAPISLFSNISTNTTDSYGNENNNFQIYNKIQNYNNKNKTICFKGKLHLQILFFPLASASPSPPSSPFVSRQDVVHASLQTRSHPQNFPIDCFEPVENGAAVNYAIFWPEACGEAGFGRP